MIINNPCIRCGKQRVVSRTYTEVHDNSQVTYTDMVCPDPECQKLLEEQFKNEKLKREKMLSEKMRQDLARQEEKKRSSLT